MTSKLNDEGIEKAIDTLLNADRMLRAVSARGSIVAAEKHRDDSRAALASLIAQRLAEKDEQIAALKARLDWAERKAYPMEKDWGLP